MGPLVSKTTLDLFWDTSIDPKLFIRRSRAGCYADDGTSSISLYFPAG